MTDVKIPIAAPVTPLFDRALIEALPVEHLCDLSIDLELGQVIKTHLGTRLTFVVKGGRFEGPRFRGEMLPGGGDWVHLGADGTSRMDVRATLRTHDGVLIHYDSQGLLRYPEDGRARLAKGERLSFDETYIRPTPRFETSDERYSWLSGMVTVGYGEYGPGRIDHRMYCIL
ncbi:hypothetical protein QFZ42_001346 [Variovorax paradoxus]|uniref:DUF3237 domain-containing protein n=1 Tax=Variovorax paradoxus TaxID=34073 RepID=UPI002791EB42|nr:DUF3237 domain-containing protein [Variovorax paradoxus]MDQ0569512.1 hypothetical protein [Variovorax paradoxus]